MEASLNVRASPEGRTGGLGSRLQRTDEVGVVLRRSASNRVNVQLRRKDACTGCKGCLLGADGAMRAEVLDPCGAPEGARVRIAVESPGPVKSGFILYMVPLIALIPGYLVATAAAGSASDYMRDLAGFLGGVASMALTYFVIYTIGKLRDRKRPRMRVVEVIR